MSPVPLCLEKWGVMTPQLLWERRPCADSVPKLRESVRKARGRSRGIADNIARRRGTNQETPGSRAEAVPKVSGKRGANAELYKTARGACMLICGQEAERIT